MTEIQDGMCPHCGSIIVIRDRLIGTHDYPAFTRQVCPGSGEIPRCAESDGRPLWNGKSNPHYYRNQEPAPDPGPEWYHKRHTHRGCPYLATLVISDGWDQQYWFCNKCGWAGDVASNLTPGDYVDVSWEDEDGVHGGVGFFDHYKTDAGSTYLVVDWGMGFLIDDNTSIKIETPPSGQQYAPIEDGE